MANNKIAYGIAKANGIDTTGMSPKEVWAALAEKGIAVTYPQNTKYEDIVKDDLLSEYKYALSEEPSITEHIKNMAKDCGLELVGLENRLKTEDSYNRKISAGNNKPIRDIIRYTALSNEDNYMHDITKFIDILKEKGYNTIVVKNTWKDGATYKGVNTFIKSPNGQVFEMQYHTKESFELKNGLLHELYEKQRVLPINSSIVGELEKEMVALSNTLIHPNKIEEIKSYGN